EIAIRAGLIRHATTTTYHSSGSWGAIAAAAVVGRVFGFDSQLLCEAMGAAEYLAPIAPMMKGIDRPNMGQDSTGWGAMVGMTAALMAAQGFTGVHPLFDDSPNPDWVLSLGHRYEILNLYFKPYACCRWTQPAIAAAIRLARAQRLAAADIAAIRVRTFAAAARLSRAHPTNTEEAQYNLAYPIAAALIDGELGPRQVLPPRLFDPDLLALADRVEVEVEPDYEAAFPARAFADVTLHTRDGRELRSGRTEAPWDASQPPTDEALRAKFLQLTTPVLGAARAQALADRIERFEQEPDARVVVTGDW
ncbi:MAG: MmgE/PrpD family protein, partial [Caldilineales bacterium]|nr:MmgE/PrpD family protein [Caldilineales bacterium]